MKTPFTRLLFAGLLLSVLSTCSSDSTPPTVPAVYNKLFGVNSVTLDGEFVVINTKDLPNYKNVYYTGDNYAPDNGNPNFVAKPNTIVEQNMTFRIPLNPKAATSHPATPQGAIGVSVNGVPFYNQWTDGASGVDISMDINSVDQYNGHIQNTGQYHYHFEPLHTTSLIGKEALLGFLLDGFPVYGPNENGAAVPGTSLDAYHGHLGPTQDYINGIYHYHITTATPYINGDGFYGTPGTVTQ